MKGVKGASIFMLLKDFNLVDGFVPDWMHGVCLGVVKNLIALWLNSENRSKAFYVGDKVSYAIPITCKFRKLTLRSQKCFNLIPLTDYLGLLDPQSTVLLGF